MHRSPCPCRGTPFSAIPYTRELQQKYASKFDCGNEALNMFLRDSISLDPIYGKTFVLISDDVIVGYYNISTGHIEDTTKERAVKMTRPYFH